MNKHEEPEGKQLTNKFILVMIKQKILNQEN